MTFEKLIQSGLETDKILAILFIASVVALVKFVPKFVKGLWAEGKPIVAEYFKTDQEVKQQIAEAMGTSCEAISKNSESIKANSEWLEMSKELHEKQDEEIREAIDSINSLRKDIASLETTTAEELSALKKAIDEGLEELAFYLEAIENEGVEE